MTRTTTTTLAVAADYADAMMVARRAKNWLFLILLIILLMQVGIFAVARFVPSMHVTASMTTGGPGATTATTQSTEISIVQRPAHRNAPGENRLMSPLLKYLIDATDFLGITLTIVLGVVLLLIVTIMLVGRLVGVAHVTSAFVWCVVFFVILFPWQTLLNSGGEWVRFTRDVKGNHAGDVVQLSVGQSSAYIAADAAERAPALSTPDVRIPGVLYTWGELARDYDFSTGDWKVAALKLTRFVGAPVIAILMLMSVQAKSSRGLKFALGESEMRVEVSAPPV